MHRITLLLTIYSAALLAQPTIPAPLITGPKEGDTAILAETRGCPAVAQAVTDVIITPKEKPAYSPGLRASLVDANAGKVRIELAEPLSEGEIVTLKYTLTCGGISYAAAQVTATVSPLDGKWIEVKAPIFDSSPIIRGKTGAAVKKVRVLIINPADFTAAEKLLDGLPPAAPGEAKNAGSRIETLSPVIGAMSRVEGSSQLAAALAREKNDPPASPPDNTNDPEKNGSEDSKDRGAVRAERLRCLSGDLSEPPIDVAVAEGAWEATATMGLEFGQCVVVQPFSPNGEAGKAPFYELEYVRSAYPDWGRLRGVFSLGTAIGQSKGQFAQADPYFSFYAEGTLMNNMLSRKAKGVNLIGLSGFGYGVHLFGEIRLSQTAVALPPIADAVKASADSRNSLWSQAGLYVPLRFSGWDWTRNGLMYSYYVAPLVKVGSSYVSDGVITQQTSTALPSEVAPLRGTIPASETVKPVTVSHSLPFYGAGIRFGVLRFSKLGEQVRNRQLSTDPILYVDYVYGQDTALRTPFTASQSVEVRTINDVEYKIATSVTGYRTDQRHMIEARMKIPNMPIQVGIDGSFSHGYFDRSPSVLRFILAVRLDAATALGKVFKK